MFVFAAVDWERRGISVGPKRQTWRPFIPARRASLALPAPLGDEHLSSGRRSAPRCPAYLPEHYPRSPTDTDSHPNNSRPAVRLQQQPTSIEDGSCRPNARRKWRILSSKTSGWKTLEMKRQQEEPWLSYWIPAVAPEVGPSPS